MPRLIPAHELEALVAQIASSPDGLDIEALAATNTAIPRRSLQAALVADPLFHRSVAGATWFFVNPDRSDPLRMRRRAS
jgi:hypothetical protein